MESRDAVPSGPFHNWEADGSRHVRWLLERHASTTSRTPCPFSSVCGSLSVRDSDRPPDAGASAATDAAKADRAADSAEDRWPHGPERSATGDRVDDPTSTLSAGILAGPAD